MKRVAMQHPTYVSKTHSGHRGGHPQRAARRVQRRDRGDAQLRPDRWRRRYRRPWWPHSRQRTGAPVLDTTRDATGGGSVVRSAMVDQLPSFSVTSSALPKYAVPPWAPPRPARGLRPMHSRSCNGTMRMRGGGQPAGLSALLGTGRSAATRSCSTWTRTPKSLTRVASRQTKPAQSYSRYPTVFTALDPGSRPTNVTANKTAQQTKQHTHVHARTLRQASFTAFGLRR